MSKYEVKTEGPQMTSQYGAYALRAGLARLQARTHVYTPSRPGNQMQARARVHTQPVATMIRERSSMLRYTLISLYF